MTVHLIPHPDPEYGKAVLMALSDSLDACSAVVDRSGRIVGATEAWQTFRGRNPFLSGQGLGASYAELCQELVHSPDDHVSSVALGLISVIEGRVSRVSFDYPFHEKYGPHDYGCTAVARPPGDDLRAVIHIRDITERKQAEGKLRESERLLRESQAVAQLGSYVFDVSADFFTSSKMLDDIFGIDEKYERSLQGWIALIHPDWREQMIVHFMQDVLVNRHRFDRDYKIIKQDTGEERWVHGLGQLEIDQDNQPKTLIGVIQDITDQKRAEEEKAELQAQLQQAQKLESLGTLAAGIAHEINTPTQYIGDNTTFLRDAFTESMALIRAMKAHFERIRDGGGQEAAAAGQALADLAAGDVDYLEKEIPRAIQQTLEGVARVTKIVGAMKDFSHPGRESATTIDLHRVIESTITVSRGEWKSVANLETEFATDFPPVACFPGEISQVILNLVVNAAHAIESRKEAQGVSSPGLIRIGTCLLPGEVEIWVSDNGTGVPAEIRDRIFDPFFTTKTVGKGSGQGLSLVHTLVTKKHRGRITLESEPGKGTTFHIFLPLDTPNR